MVGDAIAGLADSIGATFKMLGLPPPDLTDPRKASRERMARFLAEQQNARLADRVEQPS